MSKEYVFNKIKEYVELNTVNNEVNIYGLQTDIYDFVILNYVEQLEDANKVITMIEDNIYFDAGMARDAYLEKYGVKK